MIHCGDLASKETIIELAKMYQGNVYLVFGNMDRDYVTQEEVNGLGLNNIHVFDEVGQVELSGNKFAFSHYHKKVKDMARSGDYKAVFYGHWHRPGLKVANGCLVANPGNLAGIFYKASFAVYDIDSGKLELKILERL